MNISKKDLDWAADKKILSAEQADKLWLALVKKHSDLQTSTFTVINIAYYFAALLIIFSMIYFAYEVWDALSGWEISGISAVYAALFYILGYRLWGKPPTKIPGGLFITIAVSITPLIVYGIEKSMGFLVKDITENYYDFYNLITNPWIHMEIATILVGIINLKFVRFPFITIPIFCALWFMSMDVAKLFYISNFYLEARAFVSIWFGLFILIISYLIDRKTKEDFAFWGYLFGMFTFWFGITLQETDSELYKAFYCLINIGLILLSAILQRKVFVIFGGLGVLIYLLHISRLFLGDTIFFSFSLILIGIFMVYITIFYQRNSSKINKLIINTLAFRKN